MESSLPFLLTCLLLTAAFFFSPFPLFPVYPRRFFFPANLRSPSHHESAQGSPSFRSAADALRRIVGLLWRTAYRQTDPAGNVTTYDYDSNSRIRRRIDPRGYRNQRGQHDICF